MGHQANRDPEDGIVILKQTEPMMCGGTDAYQDTHAPKEILSEDMILFDVTTAFGGVVCPEEDRAAAALAYLSAFAVPAESGTFLYLETAQDDYGDHAIAWALVTEPVFPTLVTLTREHDLARRNGYHSETHGLPQNFGGSVRIRYAGGEAISFSDNQCPILSPKTGRAIAAAFEQAMAGPRAALPDVSTLTAIRFAEERDGGGFTRATLTLLPDGTGINAKASRYDDPTVYENEQPVDAETVAAIKRTVELCGLLAWDGVPDSGFALAQNKTLTFVFADGREITALSDRLLPYAIQNGFFKIELEISTKH